MASSSREREPTTGALGTFVFLVFCSMIGAAYWVTSKTVREATLPSPSPSPSPSPLESSDARALWSTQGIAFDRIEVNELWSYSENQDGLWTIRLMDPACSLEPIHGAEGRSYLVFCKAKGEARGGAR